ncbi:carbohydrate ABC transporter permease [Solwaraspora sp. WMMA2101]|uniref:carbohydrate ABC transporter permease n=1 Tax=Solwaraspora sp. WMMA2101 TaxID=3404124 RepID=UPI003B95AD9C
MTATAVAAPPTRRRRNVRRRDSSWGSPLTYALALVVVGASIAPMIYVIIGGFRTTPQIVADPAALPDPWVGENYARVLTQSGFWQQAFNSAVVAFGTTLGVVTLGLCAAFVLARYTFRGRELLYTFFTLGLLFPAGAAILPLYLMLRDMALINSYFAVILPQIAFALPLTIVILRPFLTAVPKELEDAAAIDGTGRLGFLWRIMLPLSRPALVTVGILAFVTSWNAFLLPLLVLGDADLHTLPLGVQNFSSQYTSDTAGILAFTSMAMLPALVFFTIAEKQIVGGLQGAVKG